MRILILIAALLPGMAIAAEQPKKPAPAPVATNPCAQYGDGWVLVKGTTNTCVKMGGYVRIDVGR